jgi:ribosomal protein S18 acetylase RimI-like enzyme
METILTTTSNGDIVFTEIKSMEDAQLMRKIRNDCREYMTKDTSHITEQQQEMWFNNLNKDTIKMFLMHLRYHGVAYDTIGFGYCRCIDDETYLTGGIRKEYRSKGYGKNLFLHLLENAKSFNTRITLEVLNDNTRAERLYRSIGFVDYDKNDKVTKMEYTNDSAL